VGTGNIIFNTLSVNGQTKYEGPGQGIFAFEEIRISGFGVFTPVYKTSTEEIKFQQIEVRGTGLFIPPVPRITTRDVYKINRGVLAREYGWGVVDITLGYEWSDYCPGGEGAHPPLIGPCADKKGFVDSIYGIQPDIRGINWETCPPPCQPIASMGIPGPSLMSIESIQATPSLIVHKLEDINSLKANRIEVDASLKLPTEITAKPRFMDVGITNHTNDTSNFDEPVRREALDEQVMETVSESFLKSKSDKTATEIVEDKYTQPKHKSRTIDIGMRNAPKLQEKAEPAKVEIESHVNNSSTTTDMSANYQEVVKKPENVAVLEPIVKKSFNVGLRNKKRR
jgi:hypothetical protein